MQKVHPPTDSILGKPLNCNLTLTPGAVKNVEEMCCNSLHYHKSTPFHRRAGFPFSFMVLEQPTPVTIFYSNGQFQVRVHYVHRLRRSHHHSRYEYVKSFERADTLLPNTWIVVRIDGRGFHK